MDRKSVIAIVLITIVIITMPYYYELVYDEVPAQQTTSYDSSNQKEVGRTTEPKTTEQIEKNLIELSERESDKIDLEQDSLEKIITVITPLSEMNISNKGGGSIKRLILNNYDTWQDNKVTIVEKYQNNGLNFSFQNTEGDLISLNKYSFLTNANRENIFLNENDSLILSYELNFNDSDPTIQGEILFAKVFQKNRLYNKWRDILLASAVLRGQARFTPTRIL